MAKATILRYKCKAGCGTIMDDVSFKAGKLPEYCKECKRDIMLAKLRERYAGINHKESCR